MYRNLDSEAIIATARRLRIRIEERFPERGLARVAQDVEMVALEARQKALWIEKPLWPLRAGVGLLILGLVGVSVSAFFFVTFPNQPLDLGSFVQMLESSLNDLIFIGAAVFFLVTIESRIKRSRALSVLRELRALAHIIDMHQLTKDPERLRGGWEGTPTSPVDEMTKFQLVRYLDYCSELLALLGKIAALYIQSFDDPVVLAAVDEIEDLTNGLARKIWQKIIILRSQDNDFDTLELRHEGEPNAVSEP